MEVGGQSIDASIANVGSIDEGEQPDAKEPGHDVAVKFAGDDLVELGVTRDVVVLKHSCQ